MAKNGYSLLESLIVLVVVILLAGAGYFIYKENHKHTSSVTKSVAAKQTNNPTNSAYATLTPATVPSKVVECSQQISYASNGVPDPVQCSNGDLNVTDWQALAALEPKVLTLGYDATASQVQSTLCSDVDANISNPIELTVYQIASLYYGWNFSSNPSVVLTNGTCQNVDD